MDLMNCADYKNYLNWKIKVDGKKAGYKGELSKAAGCQQSYLSRVLNGHDHLTLDHAAGISKYWGLSESETECFLELVNLARASSPNLKGIILKRIHRLRDQSRNLAERYNKKDEELSLENQTLYYSSWHWAAIHIAVTIPAYRDPQSIASAFGLELKLVRESLHRMKEMGLVTQKGAEWHPGNANVHLSRESPLLFNHLLNWRTHASINSQAKKGSSLHYTAIHSLSKSDYQKIHSILLKAMDRTREIVEPSKEEVLMNLNIDCYLVGDVGTN